MTEYVPDPADTEPLRRPALWTAATAALIGVLAGYGVPIPDDARPGMVALAAIVGPLAVWAWGRRRAWSGATVADLATRPELTLSAAELRAMADRAAARERR